MKYVCKEDYCTGCGACASICPKDAITFDRGLQSYNAVIDEDKCIGCNACERICQVNHPIDLEQPIQWYQGWSTDHINRERGSSGGVAGSISSSFVRRGGVVASCSFAEGEFGFFVAKNEDDVTKFSGSKYVKSFPGSIYSQVMDYLKKGVPVLFLGLPCQVAAIKKFVPQKLQNQLYTIDLICHGTPSPLLLERFLVQYGIKLSDVKDISFRKKDSFQVCENLINLVPNGVIDRYLLAFLLGLSYTENCYDCSYAQIQRGADVTLGDSWGSNFSRTERNRGISLILCQSKKGIELIEHGNLHLEDVDLQNAIRNNHQLEKPSVKPPARKKMFGALSRGIRFNTSVVLSIPYKCLRQDVKSILIRLNLRGGQNGYCISINNSHHR